MSTYRKRPLCRNLHPDLFDWHRERELKRTSPNATRIARRYGVTLSHAATIVRLAGLGPEATR